MYVTFARLVRVSAPLCASHMYSVSVEYDATAERQHVHVETTHLVLRVRVAFFVC